MPRRGQGPSLEFLVFNCLQEMISWLLITVISRKRSSFLGWEGRKELLLSPTSSSFLLKDPFLPSQPGKLKSFNCAELNLLLPRQLWLNPARAGRSSELLPAAASGHTGVQTSGFGPRWSVCSRKPRFETSHSARPRPYACSPAPARGPCPWHLRGCCHFFQL